MDKNQFLSIIVECERCPYTDGRVVWKNRTWDISRFLTSAFHIVEYKETLIFDGGIRLVIMDGDSVFIRNDGSLMIEKNGEIGFVTLPGIHEAQEFAMFAVESLIESRNAGLEI